MHPRAWSTYFLLATTQLSSRVHTSSVFAPCILRIMCLGAQAVGMLSHLGSR